ncbi:phosphate acyltransferase PlsX [Halanaerobacter jeridensis]|uniref:Phosphate acyltransferase n=1 Tax=Halanaerobacter jeridensis TaxID=706427 RepID=A0A938XPH1_9FIRM|nr:phosphate acyltransferase PlsX [Halanaerobacter jeridensis]MBM7556587.1 glycerol-3-phosphate acyltransferase PlsX [Halanaerobacter jeridensis]
MKIAIDAMGGDDAPQEIVKGAIKASRDTSAELILVGQKEAIRTELNNYNYDQQQIRVEPASQVITMNESPTRALRKKKDSSIVIGSNLVADNEVDAFVSAGSTGAVMAAATFNIGRIKGVKRPAIGTVFPALEGQTLLLDAGANVDSKAQNLEQQALMGHVYMKEIFAIDNPSVGLLSIGEEKKKGNKLTKKTYELLEEQNDLNFVGNAEGRDIFTGEFDIIVCDGFVGNVVLKTVEGLVKTIFKLLQSEVEKSWLAKIGGLFLKPVLKRLKQKLDYTEYGGAPLLGIDGVTIISHGSSNAKAIANAIKNAEEAAEANLPELIKADIDERTD